MAATSSAQQDEIRNKNKEWQKALEMDDKAFDSFYSEVGSPLSLVTSF